MTRGTGVCYDRDEHMICTGMSFFHRISRFVNPIWPFLRFVQTIIFVVFFMWWD